MSTATKKRTKGGRVTPRAERPCGNARASGSLTCKLTSTWHSPDGPVPVCSWCGRGLRVDPVLALLKRRFKRRLP